MVGKHSFNVTIKGVKVDSDPASQSQPDESTPCDEGTIPVKAESPQEELHEFLWLFEYGMGMDASFLNSRERLAGAALLYGSAVLKGYRIAFDAVGPQAGQIVATIEPSSEYGAEVWGVLYRIPHRLTRTEHPATEPAPLDKAHAAPYFESLQVVVYETHRKREITAITYIAATMARQQFQLLAPEQQVVDTLYAKRLVESARQHQLPDAYLQELLVRLAVKAGTQSALLEQDTEPISVVMDKTSGTATATTRHISYDRSRVPISLSGGQGLRARGHWLMAFALYLVILLLGVLTLAVLQGLGVWSWVFTAHFTPLGVPWFVLIYGLLGGCVSNIMVLERQHSINPPTFVLITWFARPYFGALLAALTYLALNSGFFTLGESVQQYNALCSLVGALAGLCAGWVCYRRA